jgi:hypothetical protein
MLDEATLDRLAELVSHWAIAGLGAVQAAA